MPCPDNCGYADVVYCTGCAHGQYKAVANEYYTHEVTTMRLVADLCGDCGSSAKVPLRVETLGMPSWQEDEEPWLWEEYACADCGSEQRTYKSVPTEVCVWRCQGVCCSECQ